MMPRVSVGDGESDLFHPSRTPPRTLGIVAALVVLPLFVLLGSLVQALHPGYGIWFSETFIFLGAAFVLVRLSGRGPWRWPGVGKLLPAQAGYGFLLGVVNFFAVIIPLQFVAQMLFPPEFAESFDSTRIFEGRSLVELVLIATGVTLAAPFAEEYFFRGVLQNAAHEAKARPWRAILGVAVLFSAFHFDPVGFAARVELGALFGWLFWRTGSLWPAVMAHAANNLITTVLFFALQGQTPPEEQTEAQGMMQVAVMAVVGLGILALCLRVLPKRHPEVLTPTPVPAGELSLPPARAYPLVAPWLVAALLSGALLFAVERRTVALNWFDIGHPLPEAVTEDEREGLRALRRRAQSGEIPLDAYEVERQSLIERHGRRDEAPAPVPDAAPPPVDPLPVP